MSIDDKVIIVNLAEVYLLNIKLLMILGNSVPVPYFSNK